MHLTSLPVSLLMTSPVVSVKPDTMLETAYQTLVDRRISSVPVIDETGRLAGVLSTTDVLRVGRLGPASLAGVRVLDLPAEPVSGHMQAGVITVTPDTPAAEASLLLAEQRIHRLYVMSGDRVVGVFSTEEVLVAIRERRIETPIEAHMTTPVETISMFAPISEAAARLDRAHVSGLAVVDEHDHPAGVFSKTEALWSQSLPADTPVEEVMSYRMLQKPAKTALFRAAAHAYDTRARRVFVLRDHKVHGVLTGLDFARALAEAGGTSR